MSSAVEDFDIHDISGLHKFCHFVFLLLLLLFVV